MAADGRFTVVFPRVIREPDGVPSASVGIFGRRFDTAGAPLGGEFRASAVGRSTFRGEIDVAMDTDGDFVVGWIEQETDPGETNLHTRLYAASGTPLTPDRSYGFGHVGPRDETVAMDGKGNFVATWSAQQRGSGRQRSQPEHIRPAFRGPRRHARGLRRIHPKHRRHPGHRLAAGLSSRRCDPRTRRQRRPEGRRRRRHHLRRRGRRPTLRRAGTDHLLGGPGTTCSTAAAKATSATATGRPTRIPRLPARPCCRCRDR